jgi:hypothetical protein
MMNWFGTFLAYVDSRSGSSNPEDGNIFCLRSAGLRVWPRAGELQWRASVSGISNGKQHGGLLMCTGHSRVQLEEKTSWFRRTGFLASCAALMAALAGASAARAQGETAGGEANLKLPDL